MYEYHVPRMIYTTKFLVSYDLKARLDSSIP